MAYANLVCTCSYLCTHVYVHLVTCTHVCVCVCQDYINFKASSESGDDDDDCAEYTESEGFHRHLPSSSSPSPGM